MDPWLLEIFCCFWELLCVSFSREIVGYVQCSRVVDRESVQVVAEKRLALWLPLGDNDRRGTNTELLGDETTR